MQLLAPNRSNLSYVFLQVGKIKVTHKRGLKILWIHCQNSESIMTNGIKKVRLGVDRFDKRIKEFLIHLGQCFSNLFLAAGRV